jgi:F-type H+-transporting ATPase subunit delta
MSAVTSRYARAFADVTLERKLDSARVLQEVHGVLDLMEQSQELRRVLENPAIPADQKRGLLDAIAGRMGMLKEVRNFLAVLVDHQRIAFLGAISRQFEHELNERLGFAEAEITSSRALSDTERRELEIQVSKLTGKRVLAKYHTDAKLLGGAVVRIGSTIYDGSVRGQLEKIREQLSS